ncbi:hypothetical protein ACQEVF_07855 [Nonomuraea polychroma]|uniref:hypothetical protein n=1 Tax=Nonomuraea polychroma TaxID=46176 RepID=UPI003D907216
MTLSVRPVEPHDLDMVSQVLRDSWAAPRWWPSIPLEADGIPIRHELELELIL